MLSTKHCCATVVETHLPRPVLVDAVERVEEPFRFRVRQAQRLKGWGHVLRVEAMQQGMGEGVDNTTAREQPKLQRRLAFTPHTVARSSHLQHGCISVFNIGTVQDTHRCRLFTRQRWPVAVGRR